MSCMETCQQRPTRSQMRSWHASFPHLQSKLRCRCDSMLAGIPLTRRGREPACTWHREHTGTPGAVRHQGSTVDSTCKPQLKMMLDPPVSDTSVLAVTHQSSYDQLVLKASVNHCQRVGVTLVKAGLWSSVLWKTLGAGF